MMNPELRFDTSLEEMVRVLNVELPQYVIEAGLVLRDASGQLTFVAASELDDNLLDRCQLRLSEALGPYGRDGRAITDPRTLDPASLDQSTAHDVWVESVWVRYLDRRIVGVDWLAAPVDLKTTPPRLVFTSLKGGVGRSTALTVVAAQLASEGRNILVVDLDLEAPGIGSLLLPEDRLPAFGVLDYLVETNLGNTTLPSSASMVGISPLTGPGLVHVVPVVGTATRDRPENFVGKLGRGLSEAVTNEGTVISLAEKLERLLTALEAQGRYDLVLIDSRAGLAEITAGPMLTLGATKLLFGTSQRQTLQDLAYLLAHLEAITPSSRVDFWSSLKMVHAKAGSLRSQEAFRDQLWDLFTEHLYEEQTGITEFNFDADDPMAPHYAIVIPMDTKFLDWDPVGDHDNLLPSFYESTFSQIILYVKTFLT